MLNIAYNTSPRVEGKKILGCLMLIDDEGQPNYNTLPSGYFDCITFDVATLLLCSLSLHYMKYGRCRGSQMPAYDTRAESSSCVL